MALDWIVAPELRHVTPNVHRAGDPQVHPIDFVVIHYTEGDFPGCLTTLCLKTKGAASAHFLVTRDGVVIQMVSLLDRAFHAGGSHEVPAIWPGDGHGNVNNRSIGIELENLGRLHPGPPHGPIWVAEDGAIARGPVQVWRDPTKQAWEDFPPDQINALGTLLRQLMTEFPQLARGPHRFVGHSTVDPSRRIDPGPAFPWDRVRYLIGQPSASVSPQSGPGSEESVG